MNSHLSICLFFQNRSQKHGTPKWHRAHMQAVLGLAHYNIKAMVCGRQNTHKALFPTPSVAEMYGTTLEKARLRTRQSSPCNSQQTTFCHGQTSATQCLTRSSAAAQPESRASTPAASLSELSATLITLPSHKPGSERHRPTR